MFCIKLDKKIKKNLKFALLEILRLFKNLKNLGFFEAIFQPLLYRYVCVCVQTRWVKRERKCQH